MSIDTPNPSDMRIVYDKDQLTEADLASNPLDQFTKWLADAVAEGKEALIEPNAMVRFALNLPKIMFRQL